MEGANAAVSIAATPSPSMTGDLVTYTIKATNHGTADLTDVVVEATLPPGSTVFDAVPAASSGAGDTLTLAIPALPVGGSTFWVVRARAPEATGPVVATAHVSAPGDVDPSDDAATASVVIQSDACFVPRDGLVAKYSGEGDARDGAAGRDGRIIGPPVFLPGHQGQGFYFAGGLDYVTVPDSPAFRPAEFTLSAWVNPYILASGWWNSVIAKGATGADPAMPGYANSFWLGFYDGFPTLYTFHEGSDGRSVQAAARVSTHTWHHLAATYDGTTARLYVDGALAGETPVGIPLYYEASPIPLTIATDWQNGQADVTQGLTASVDEVLLYARALGAATIEALAAETPVDCGSAGPPTVTVPADITVVTNDPAGQAVTFTATGADAGGTPLVPVCTPASGTVFAVGATTVTCTATDARGSSASGTFSVTVVRNAPPTVTVPADVTFEGNTLGGAVVTFTSSGQDVEDGPLNPDCQSRSGSVFPVGATVVACTVTDSRGAIASASFVVRVADTVPPVFTVSDLTATSGDGSGVAVAFAFTATDVVDGTDPVVCVPPSGTVFLVGSTTVTCSSADHAGNTAVHSFTVTITRTGPPPRRGPIARADAYATDRGVRLTVGAPGVLANDTDRQGGGLTASLVSGPAHGVLTLRADGSLTYTPRPGFSGLDSFVYTARDSRGRSDRAIVVILVRARRGR